MTYGPPGGGGPPWGGRGGAPGAPQHPQYAQQQHPQQQHPQQPYPQQQHPYPQHQQHLQHPQQPAYPQHQQHPYPQQQQQQQQQYAQPQQHPHGGHPQPPYAAPPAPHAAAQAAQPHAPAGPAGKPLARLPLQIGTTATWGAGRAAATLFPGIACIVGGFALLAAADSDLEAMVFPAIVGGLFIAYAFYHLWTALKTRASDLLLFPEGLHIDGGRLNGSRLPWRELTPPYAHVEETQASRLTVWRIFVFAFSLLARNHNVSAPTAKVTVWRLWVHQGGQARLLGESDRPIEADSMRAAASSIEAVVSGQKYVAEAPAVQQHIAVCNGCGSPAVPDDAPAVVCAFCQAWVELPPQVRGQAAAAKAMAHTRTRSAKMIAKLLDQPRAATSNMWLLVFTLLMFGAWPLGWSLTAWRVLEDGYEGKDLAFLMLPFAAVLAGFFLARGRLADRGALQMLTLGFGALAPRREGEPSRCRRCQGPLPEVGLGGVAQCRYCTAENIVGLDLRPTVDQARTEQLTFDDALRTRGRERVLWGVLSAVAVVALLGWVAGTIAYIVS